MATIKRIKYPDCMAGGCDNKATHAIFDASGKLFMKACRAHVVRAKARVEKVERNQVERRVVQ